MLTMGQFSKVLLAVDKAHTVSKRALDWGPDFGGLNQVYGPTRLHSFNSSLTIPFPGCYKQPAQRGGA